MTVENVAALIAICTAAVGLLIARTQPQRWASMFLMMATLAADSWWTHDGRFRVAAFAALAVWFLVLLIRSRRTTSGK